jgi:hypothetical protein
MIETEQIVIATILTARFLTLEKLPETITTGKIIPLPILALFIAGQFCLLVNLIGGLTRVLSPENKSETENSENEP